MRGRKPRPVTLVAADVPILKAVARSRHLPFYQVRHARIVLKRGSWHSREELIEHVLASAPEYNRLYAHPFQWTWTNQKMRQWFAKHAS